MYVFIQRRQRISSILWGPNVVRFETLMAALKFNRIDGPHPFSLRVCIHLGYVISHCTVDVQFSAVSLVRNQ